MLLVEDDIELNVSDGRFISNLYDIIVGFVTFLGTRVVRAGTVTDRDFTHLYREERV